MMATQMVDRNSKVTEASEADLRAAVERALLRCGCTFSELALQAKAGRLKSLEARLAWVAIGDLPWAGDPEAAT
jgi:hypothetical protein